MEQNNYYFNIYNIDIYYDIYYCLFIVGVNYVIMKEQQLTFLEKEYKKEEENNLINKIENTMIELDDIGRLIEWEHPIHYQCTIENAVNLLDNYRNKILS